MPLRCTTCNVEVSAKTSFVKFSCPNCGQTLIIRCSQCKTLNNKYTCSACKWTGP